MKRTEVEAMVARAEHASTGPLAMARSHSVTREAMKAEVAVYIDSSPLPDEFYVVLADGSHRPVVCVTGNGKHSEANAEFFAHAVDDLPRLAALALGFGDAMERALGQIDTRSIHRIEKAADILRAALADWRKP